MSDGERVRRGFSCRHCRGQSPLVCRNKLLNPRMKSYILALSRFFFVVLGILVLIAAVNFPYHYDAPLSRQEIDAAQKYYSNAYLKTAEPRQTQGGHETQYLRLAVQATKDFAIEEQV